MALTPRFIIDTSALARLHDPTVGTVLRPMIDLRLVATTPALDAEVLYSARSAKDHDTIRARRRTTYTYLSVVDRHWEDAFDAQSRLARTGRHRAVGITDLLTAVVAAEHRVIVVHYDQDFEIAAEVVDFTHRWVVPRGAVA